MIFTMIDTPIGTLLLAGDGERLARIGFPAGKGRVDPGPDWVFDPSAHDEARRQLQSFFAGQRSTFDLPLAPVGTPFQQRVWTALQSIPFGMTTTYGALARRLGQPTASRAVGAANGLNPLPIVVPCHRVVGADGALTGFAGGLATKRWLLDHERGGPCQPPLL